MSLPYCLPYGLWIMYSRVVQGIALNPGVRLVTAKPATRQLYTRHRGTDFKRFCCKKLKRASAVWKTTRARESLGSLHDTTTIPSVQNLTMKEPNLAPSVALVVVAPGGRYVGLDFRVQGLGFRVWGLGFRV